MALMTSQHKWREFLLTGFSINLSQVMWVTTFLIPRLCVCVCVCVYIYQTTKLRITAFFTQCSIPGTLTVVPACHSLTQISNIIINMRHCKHCYFSYGLSDFPPISLNCTTLTYLVTCKNLRVQRLQVCAATDQLMQVMHHASITNTSICCKHAEYHTLTCLNILYCR
jgi:hypothetical protein